MKSNAARLATNAQIPSFIAETGNYEALAELPTLRPGTPLRLRRPHPRQQALRIDIQTTDGRTLGRVPAEDAMRLRAGGYTPVGATVTAVVPAPGRARVLIRLLTAGS